MYSFSILQVQGMFPCTEVPSIPWHRLQGNCTEAPPNLESFGLTGPPFKWEAPQCVIVNDHLVFGVFNILWMDSLLMRATQKPEARMLFVTAFPGSRLFGTRLTFQGSGSGNITVLQNSWRYLYSFSWSRFDFHVYTFGEQCSTFCARGGHARMQGRLCSVHNSKCKFQGYALGKKPWKLCVSDV